MKKKIFAALFYVNLILALLIVFFSLYFFAFSSRPVFVQESYVVYDFSNFNISDNVGQRVTFYGNVVGMHLFYKTANYTGPFYEFVDSNGTSFKLVSSTNETFELGTSYIILARIVTDSGICTDGKIDCENQYFLEAIMRNR